MPVDKSGPVLILHLGFAVVSLHSCKTTLLRLIYQSILTVYQCILMAEEDVYSSTQCLVLHSCPCFSCKNQCSFSLFQETSATCVGQHQSQSGVKRFKGKQSLSVLSNYTLSDRVFMGTFGLNERKKRTGLKSRTGHEQNSLAIRFQRKLVFHWQTQAIWELTRG